MTENITGMITSNPHNNGTQNPGIQSLLGFSQLTVSVGAAVGTGVGASCVCTEVQPTNPSSKTKMKNILQAMFTSNVVLYTPFISKELGNRR